MDNIGHKGRETRELAALLFPEEEWIFKEPNIYVAKSRLAEERWEPEKWEREMGQARILTNRGSVAYFLPDGSADTVIDGELKTRFDTGKCIYYFETTGELYYWSYEELRAMIGKK